MRCGIVGGRPVLLSARPRCVRRSRLLRPTRVAVRRAGRPVRRGLCDRTRVRTPRAEPAGSLGASTRRLDRSDVVVGAARAAGRLLRGRVGRRTRSRPTTSRSSRATTSRRASTPPPRSATTGSRSRCRVRSTRRHGRTVPRSSGRTGSPPGTTPPTPTTATPSPHPRCNDRFLRQNPLLWRGFCRRNMVWSVEVAGVQVVGQAEGQAGDAARHQVDHALVPFEHTADPKRR